MRSRQRRRGFSLIEVLVATVIMAVAVSAILANLSTSTMNLLRTSDLDRIQHLAKRKMDEALTVQNPPRFVWLEGAFATNEKQQVISGWRIRYSPYEGLGGGSNESLERVELEAWYQSGSRRRFFTIESYRRTFASASQNLSQNPSQNPNQNPAGVVR